MIDFRFHNHGSITILTPLTEAAQEWLDDNVQQGPETQYWGGGIVIEPRYVDPILSGIDEAGMTVST